MSRAAQAASRDPVRRAAFRPPGAVRAALPALAAALVVALPAALLAPRIVAGTHSFLTFFDAVEQTYPWYQKLARAVHAGYVPIWDAGTYSGHSFVGELQPGALYPVNLLAVAAAGGPDGMPARAIDLLIVAHLSLAALGMWLLLRRWAASLVGATAGALLFALSGAVAFRAAGQVGIFYGLCWLPWAMLLADRHFDRGGALAGIGAGAVVGVQILAGHLQPAIHTALLIGTFGIAMELAGDGPGRARARRLLRSALLIGGAALVVAGPQLLLSIQYLSDAYRWVGAPEPIGPGDLVPWSVFGTQYVLGAGHLASLLDPWWHPAGDVNSPYLTMVGLGLALAGATVAWRTARDGRARARVAWLWCVLIGGLVIASGNLTFLPILLRPLPLVGAIRELGRWIVLFHFAACVFAGIGADHLWRDARALGQRGADRKWWLAAALVFAELAYASFPASGLLSARARVQSALAAGLVATLAAVRPRPLRAVLVLGLTVAAVSASWRLYLPERAPELAVERRFARNAIIDFLEPFYGRARVILDANAPLQRNLGDVYRIETTLGYGATMWRPYYEFLGHGWAIDSRVHDLLNVRWVISDRPLPLERVLADPTSGLVLYQRATWLPRAFTRTALASGVRDAAGTIVLERYADEVQRYRVRLGRGDELIFAELDYPGWQARVDGVRAPHHRARIGDLPPTLRALDLPAGTHEVVWRYCPLGFCLG